MLDMNSFKHASIDCSNDYIMAAKTLKWEEAIIYMERNNLDIDCIIFKPISSQIRITFISHNTDANIYETFNINQCPDIFLRKLLELKCFELNVAIKKYIELRKNKNTSN